MVKRLYLLIAAVLILPSLILFWLGLKYQRQEESALWQEARRTHAREAEQIKDWLISRTDDLLRTQEQFLRSLDWEKDPSAQLAVFARSLPELAHIALIHDQRRLVTPNGTISLKQEVEPFEPARFEREIALIRQAERIELVDQNYPEAISQYQQLFINVLDPTLRARLLNTIARCYLKAGLYQKAADYYRLLLKQDYQYTNWDGISLAVAAYRQIHLIAENLKDQRLLEENLLLFYQDLVNDKIPLTPSFYQRQLEWVRVASSQMGWEKNPKAQVLFDRERRKARLEKYRDRFCQDYLPLFRDLDRPRLFFHNRPAPGLLTILTQNSQRAFLISQFRFSAWLEHQIGTRFDTLAKERLWSISVMDPSGASARGSSSKVLKEPAVRPDSIQVKSQWVSQGLMWQLSLNANNPQRARAGLTKRRQFYAAAFSIFACYIFASIIFSIKIIAKELELSRLKADFAEHVSHELKTPLTSIRMYSDILADDPQLSPKRRREFISILRNEAERLSELVKKVLIFSKVQRKSLTAGLTPLSLNRHVAEAVKICRAMKTHRDFKFRLLPAANDPWIHADPLELQQVWANLLENAVKYSRERKEVIVRISDLGQRVSVEIQDFGIGMSRSETRRVFEKYYRVQEKDTVRREGFGLGLAIVQNILKQHKARIDIDSSKGQGTRVVVIFRKCAPQEDAGHAKPDRA